MQKKAGKFHESRKRQKNSINAVSINAEKFQ
jgi:hypothetical protein